MHMNLDDMELIKRFDENGVVKEIRSVHNIAVSGKRRIVELQIPGSTGNVFQDMGRVPLRISFDGEFLGPSGNKALQDLKSKFELKTPVPFSTDIPTLSDVTEVVIESFLIFFSEVAPFGSRYSIVLREHKSSSMGGAPGPGETEPPNQDENAKQDVEQKISKIFEDTKSGS
jgi:hypothetical protein